MHSVVGALFTPRLESVVFENFLVCMGDMDNWLLL